VALLFLGVLGVLQLFGRVVMMWLYNVTGSSVLLVGLWHASFDATTSAFGRTFALPGAAWNAELAGFWIPSAVVVVFAVLAVVLTRGRFAYRPPGPARPEQPPLRAEGTVSLEGSPMLLTKGDGS
jgi:hypothetical protein